MKEDPSADYFLYPFKYWSIEWSEEDVIEAANGRKYVQNDNYDWLAYLDGYRNGLLGSLPHPSLSKHGTARTQQCYLQGFNDAIDNTYQ